MAEVAVSFLLKQLAALVGNEATLLRGVPREFAEIKVELESIRASLKDADRRAVAEGEEREGIKTWVKQLREACFRIEDVIDEYMFDLAHRPRYPQIAALLKGISSQVKTYHQIALEIQDIKSTLSQIKERSDRYMFQSSNEVGSSSRVNNASMEYDPRMASLFIEEAEVVGFEVPKRKLIDWLRHGEAGRTAISIVGMGGLGKTTLAKKVFDDPDVINHFDCRAWITVSESYTIESLLREMMAQFYKARRDQPLPEDLSKMDKTALIAEVRNYLQKNRYVVFFDDVWKVEFWGEIEHAIPDNKKSSRVIITTRKKGVADFCMTSSLCHVHEQKPLPPNDAWTLFCKKTFRNETDGRCPAELEAISREILHRCEGLPLAIVTIGGLLLTKKKVKDKWEKLCKNLSSELESNPHLTSLTRILAFSYDDLPYYLKSCFLYFGIYPEDYAISCARLTRKWIAEGFVEPMEGKTLEEVAEEYLSELIHRSLVQVSFVHLDGTAKTCRIHDMLREIIIRKMKDLSFARFVHDDDQSVLDTITRRLAIATSSVSVLSSVGHPYIRAVYIFESDALPESFLSTFPTKFMLVKVLDFENASLNIVPDNLGKMYHLRYLSLRNTSVQCLPKTIGKLLNLETLDLRNTLVREIPDQIKKLTKLRHLLVYQQNRLNSSLTEESGVRIKEGVGCMTSLQKLYYVQANHGRIDLIRELSKLRQLRKLGLKQIRKDHGEALCASIRVMEKLESLDITATHDDILDLHYIPSPPKLRKLCLLGRLESLPDWIRRLECLVKLTISYSNLNEDPLDSLKNLPNLLDLSICNNAYDGEVLCFQEGKFQKLKNLFLEGLNRLNSIVIESGTLPVLEQLEIWSNPRLRGVPSGIRSLQNLQVLDFTDLPDEFTRSIDPEVGGEFYAIIEHVPTVRIRTRGNPVRGIDVYHTRTLHPRRMEN